MKSETFKTRFFFFFIIIIFPCWRIKRLPKSRETKRPKWLVGISICQIGHPEQVLYIITIIEWCMTPLCYESPCGHGESQNNIIYNMLMILFVSYFKTLLYNIKIWSSLCDQKRPLLNIVKFTAYWFSLRFIFDYTNSIGTYMI